jgi:hypothetical protein
VWLSAGGKWLCHPPPGHRWPKQDSDTSCANDDLPTWPLPYFSHSQRIHPKMAGSRADSFDFSAQYPPQDTIFFSVWAASTEPTKLTPYTRTGTMVSTSSVAAPAAASKVTNSPPSQPNLHRRLVVWDCPFPAAPLPMMVDCWLSLRYHTR